MPAFAIAIVSAAVCFGIHFVPRILPWSIKALSFFQEARISCQPAPHAPEGPA